MQRTQRVLTGPEALFLAVFAAHAGREPLKQDSARRRIVPFGVDETWLLDQDYIRRGKTSAGKVAEHTYSITREGRDVLARDIGDTIAESERLAANAGFAKEAEHFRLLVERLRKLAADMPKGNPWSKGKERDEEDDEDQDGLDDEDATDSDEEAEPDRVSKTGKPKPARQNRAKK